MELGLTDLEGASHFDLCDQEIGVQKQGTLFRGLNNYMVPLSFQTQVSPRVIPFVNSITLALL